MTNEWFYIINKSFNFQNPKSLTVNAKTKKTDEVIIYFVLGEN